MAKKITKLQMINNDINAIFKKHKIKVGPGNESFWIGVDEVKEKSKADAKKLKALGKAWELEWNECYEC